MLKIFKFTLDILDKKQKNTLKYILVLSFLATILETLSIASVIPLISSLANNNSINIFEKFKIFIELESSLILLSIFSVVCLIFTLKAAFLIYYSKIKASFIETVKVDKSNNLFLFYLNQPFLFHVKNNSSKLIRNLNEAQALGYIIRTVIESILEVLMLFVISLFLFFLNPKILLSCVIIFAFFGFLSSKYINKKAQKWGEQRKKFAGLKLKELQQGFSSIRDIKIHNKQNFFAESFSEKNKIESESNFNNIFFSGLPRILFEWIGVISTLIFLFFISHENNIKNSLPVLGAFGLAAYRLIPSVTRILHANQTLKYWFPITKPYIEKSLDDKNKKIKTPNYAAHVNDKTFLRHSGEIYFKNISFKFENSSDYVFRDINFKITENDFIGIFGSSGSGKTTLINLLLGLYYPSEGEIFIDKTNINKNLNIWRNLISFIPQNVYIIDDTIGNNVAYGNYNKDIDINKINDSLKKANADKFVNKLKNNIDTQCGELGEFFSGGQKQRIAIARALYNNSKILIFDEFTNFLDEKNEIKIIKEIAEMKDKTRVIVSHSKNVLSHCSSIYEIKDRNIIKKK